MRVMTDRFLAVAVVLLTLASPAFAGDSGDGGDVGMSAPCGQLPGDHNAVTGIRAVADKKCDCNGADNHGKYVACVARIANTAVKKGVLRPECFGTVVSCAGNSTCGKPGAVTCCMTDKNGHKRCVLRKSEAACKPFNGGTACVSDKPSCCDACGPNGCPGGGSTTSTTEPATTTTSSTASTTASTASTTSSTTSSTTTTTGPSCGNGMIDPGEQCDPPGSPTCPGGSPGGAMLDCLAGCVCPGVTTSSTTSSTTVTTTSSTTATTVPTTSSTTATTATTTSSTTGTTATTTSSTTATTATTTSSTTATTATTTSSTTATTATTTSSTTATTATTTSSTTATTATTTSSTTATTATTSTTSSTTSSTTATTTSSTTTTTLQTCCGFSPQPSRLSFTTSVGTGNCGTIQSSAGVVTRNLQCGGLFTGGGSNTVPLPYAVPDQGTSLTGVTTCSGTSISLTNLTSAQTGSIRNCTSVGCLFGPPLPIPNSVSTPTSVCVVNAVSTNASGTADCVSGVSNLSLPLTSNLFLDGDLLPNRPGIQVCPVCLAGACVGDAAHDGLDCTSSADCGTGTCALANTCHGGANDGMPCTPADTAVNAGFPTTHDCPPPALNNIGGLPIAFNLTTGTTSVTARALSGQSRVFCGFCRDINAAGTGCFSGDPDPGCPHNAGCVGAGVPFNCCTGAGTGSCDPQVVIPCTSAAQCSAAGNGTWPDCQQRNQGAFGPAGGGANTINETGSPAGNMTDGAGHASTLVSIFCIQPTFNATVDAAGDLPGPGAVSLPGTTQLLP